ncbi:MAG TPA: type IX secretion system outer membrane channel protein PorV [Chitinophagales bacterium]|nr:type IX secretion system outer membrane channel protein PorV [Chitinophagales bacterium]
MNYLLRTKSVFAFLGAIILSAQFANGQSVNYKDNARINTVTTAVPFLRINPDARAGGMGDVGLATPVYGNGDTKDDYQSPDVNAIYVNPAKLAFIDKDFGFSVGFSPWLKALVNDIYLANLAGYYKIKKQQTIAISLRYFSLGNITFTDYNGQELQTFRPQEFAIDAHYARRLGPYFSVAASLRFIYSNLAGGASVDGSLVRPGLAGAGDISAFFRKKFNENAAHKMEHELSVGLNISNIGSKISYTSSTVKDFIPTNLGLGVGYTFNIDKHHSVGVYADVNKLMVPTADTIDANPRDGVYDFRKKSSIGGMFTSFNDAPGVIDPATGQRVKGSRSAEEFAEVTWGIGAEYLYNKQFGVRFGYFYENPKKGNRQFLTAGLTVKYSVVGLNFSYLIPTTIQRNPLDNTLRFTLLFDFAKGGGKASSSETGISLVDDTPKKKKEKKVKEGDAPVENAPVEKKIDTEPK